MSPTDIRDRNFEELKNSLEESRARVYRAWLARGAGTTRSVALESGIDLLNVRPRTTELVQLGLLELIRVDGHEGVYQARTQAEWEAWIAGRCGAVTRQLEML